MKTKILQLNGSPYENGRKSGEFFKGVFERNISNFNKGYEQMKKYDYLLNLLNREYPKYYDEIVGKADGFGVKIEDYFHILCPEISELYEEHCSTIMCRRSNGSWIICHNEDDDYIEGNFYLSKVKIDDKNWFVTNDMFNMPFGNGFSWNSYGLIKTINYCHEDTYNLDYLPRYFSQRHISEASSIDDLIYRCRDMKIASGYHVNAIDINTNTAVSVEVYGDSISVQYIDDSYVHTNHYIHGSRINTPSVEEGSNSVFRLRKATELLNNIGVDDRNVKSIKRILDYRGKDDSFESSIYQNMSDPYITLANISFDTEFADKVNIVTYATGKPEKLELDYNTIG